MRVEQAEVRYEILYTRSDLPQCSPRCVISHSVFSGECQELSSLKFPNMIKVSLKCSHDLVNDALCPMLFCFYGDFEILGLI